MLTKQKQKQLTNILESQKIINLRKELTQKKAIIKMLKRKIKEMENGIQRHKGW